MTQYAATPWFILKDAFDSGMALEDAIQLVEGAGFTVSEQTMAEQWAEWTELNYIGTYMPEDFDDYYDEELDNDNFY